MFRIASYTLIYLLLRLTPTFIGYVIFSIVTGSFSLNDWSLPQRILLLLTLLINLFFIIPKVLKFFVESIKINNTNYIKQQLSSSDIKRHLNEIKEIVEKKLNSGEITENEVEPFIKQELEKRNINSKLTKIKMTSVSESAEISAQKVATESNQKVLVRKNEHYILDNFDIEINESIPVGVYLLGDGQFGTSLKRVSTFKFPEIMYSNDDAFINHVTKTFGMSDENLGVLLTGKKGLGKSVTAKRISLNVNLPIIMVDRQIDFNDLAFLNNLKFPHVLYIDEFDKLFEDTRRNANENNGPRVTQESFLSFLDGATTSSAKKLFIITTNNSVNSFLLNRPSRLRYVKKYDEIEQSTIEEIINNKLKNKDFVEDLIENLSTEGLNIDILNKICDEINLHNSSYSSFKNFFNFIPDKVDYIYSVKPEGFKEFFATGSLVAHNSLNSPNKNSKKCLPGFYNDVIPSKEALDFVHSAFPDLVKEIGISNIDCVQIKLSDDMKAPKRFIDVKDGVNIACIIELMYVTDDNVTVKYEHKGQLLVRKSIEKINYVY